MSRRQKPDAPTVGAEVDATLVASSDSPMPEQESLAAKRRRIAEERQARLEAQASDARRPGVDAMGRTSEEAQREGCGVLYLAHLLVQRDGLPLLAAVQEAGGGGIAFHYTQRIWLAAHREPIAKSSEVAQSKGHRLALLEAAIYRAGGAPPPRQGRPGPKVGQHSKPTPEEVERRKALHAASRIKPSNT